MPVEQLEHNRIPWLQALVDWKDSTLNILGTVYLYRSDLPPHRTSTCQHKFFLRP